MKLNLGCGSTKYPGFKNIDILKNDNVDIVLDLNKQRWPFADEEVEEILAEDVLEHLQDTPSFMEEVWRVLQPGGLITIQVPDVINNPMSAFTDPTHIKFFTEHSFDYWDEGTEFGKKYGYYYEHKFVIINKTYPAGNIRVSMVKED